VIASSVVMVISDNAHTTLRNITCPNVYGSASKRLTLLCDLFRLSQKARRPQSAATISGNHHAVLACDEPPVARFYTTNG